VKSNDKRNIVDHPARKGVAFFPTLKSMSGNPYWLMLAAELTKKGIFLEYNTPAYFNSSWLRKNHNQIKVLHLHYIQQFYSESRLTSKIKLIGLFAFNMFLARALGYRTVFTLHNLEPTYPRAPAWLDYLGHWIAANFSERVIVHCDEARRLLANRYGRRRSIFFVNHPNFIDFYTNTIANESAKKRLDLPVDSIVFLFFGGIRPNKGIEILIQAFQKLQYENIHLVIGGNETRPGPYAQSLVDLASNDKRISLHIKYIPDEEIQIFMNAADIVVLPFAKILTSSTANLAMSFARPLIVPRMGCLPELIEPDSGWLFEPNDAESLSVAMISAMESDYHQIGQNAFNKVSEFTPERFGMQTIEAYLD